jgi:hypothetical protein
MTHIIPKIIVFWRKENLILAEKTLLELLEYGIITLLAVGGTGVPRW